MASGTEKDDPKTKTLQKTAAAIDKKTFSAEFNNLMDATPGLVRDVGENLGQLVIQPAIIKHVVSTESESEKEEKPSEDP